MIKLKQVIHDTKTNSIEATWVNETHPAVDVPESVAPDTVADDGSVIPGEVMPAHTIPAVQVQVKCHSYADVQMQMFRADLVALGGSTAEHESVIAAVEAGIVQPTAAEIAERAAAAAIVLQAQIEADALAVERAGLAAQIDKLTLAIDQYQALLDVPYSEPAQAGTTALEITALRARMRSSERGARDIWRDLISTMKSAKYLLRQSRRGL